MHNAGFDISRLPYSLKILLENLLRNENGRSVTKQDIEYLASWQPGAIAREIAFAPARVVLQDFTGVPAIVDLAAMRDAMAAMGGDPKRINPLVPVELVVDHSVQVDSFASPDALEANLHLEYARNKERYAFLRWGQQAFSNLRVVPPNTGIVHQVNLEYLARVVFSEDAGSGIGNAYPDSCVGTDSHTPMVNALGVLAWGVGGIEAEAAMLGQPITMLLPEIIGFKVAGVMREGVTATDLVLTITNLLRKYGVVGKFIEFFGDGLRNLSIADRATISNMSPEYGCTCSIFPPDEVTLQYLKFTGRSDEQLALVEGYLKEQGLMGYSQRPEPVFSNIIELDLDSIRPCVAGPKRPQDRVALNDVPAVFKQALPDLKPSKQVDGNGGTGVSMNAVKDGSVVIAAITSCTNTSNPSVMLAAGLLARKAVEAGLTRKPWVKTSLAPGSKAVTEYYRRSGLDKFLDRLGFNLVGYGCTTCIGNSGPLSIELSEHIQSHALVACSVLSGNRNFEGRIHPEVRANFLMSPPLVVAYAIAGSVNWNPVTDPLGQTAEGKNIFLKDIWPSSEEIQEVMLSCLSPELYTDSYKDVFEGDDRWKSMETPGGARFEWDESSTYVRCPPYFDGLSARSVEKVHEIKGARVLAYLGDSVTTDHISPAGSIKASSPAGEYLNSLRVQFADFNSYGSRRGNHEVMVRGTFANGRIRNRLAPDTEGGFTTHLPSGTIMSIYDAAMRYLEERTPLLVLAGQEYGSGSSRDWAAKGPYLQGVKFVLAESYERIHRSNLVGMGILPLQYFEGETGDKLGLRGREHFDLIDLEQALRNSSDGPRILNVIARAEDGTITEFAALIRIDTPQEMLYYRHGGILQYVLRQLLSGRETAQIVSGGMRSGAVIDGTTGNADRAATEGSQESFPASDSPAY